MDNTDRHLELSSKFLEMGRALIQEGTEKMDFSIAQMGSCMILMGGIMFDEKDVQMFGQLCAMFSAKKVLEGMERNNDDYIKYLRDKSASESYEDFIKRINKLRGDNGH